MKSLHLMGLAVAALSCVSFAGAQEAAEAAGVKLTAYVQLPQQKKPEILEINRSDGNDKFYYMQKGTDQEMEMAVSSCKALFYIQTPVDLANALNTFREGDLEAARKQLAAVKAKYANFAGLPGSPYTIAAVHEISCAVRLQDWDSVATLTANPPANMLATETARVATAALVAQIASGKMPLDEAKKAITELLKDKKNGKNINSELYGWLRYALARAYAAKLPTDGSPIPEDQLKDAESAIDNYCQCVVSTHGVADELPVDAMVRAMNLLWGMPGVADYIKKADAPLNKTTWAAAPANFRDAVAMAHLLKTVYAPELKNELADKLAPYFYNSAKDRKKEAAQEEK